MVDYLSIYKQLPDDGWHTAAELGLSAGTLRAMSTRLLVESDSCSPKHYHKLSVSVFQQIDSIMGKPENKDIEYFTLYRKNEQLGMYCRLKLNKVVDCWDHTYDLSGVYQMKVGSTMYAL
jgi:hypothetical protein